MTLGPRETWGVVLRLALWLPLLLWTTWIWGWHYAHFFNPLYQYVLNHLLDGLQVGDIQLIHTREYMFSAPYVVEAMQVIHGHFISRNMDGSVQQPIYYALTHPIVLATAALVWPGLSWKGRILRLLVSLPVLLLLEAVDIPLIIYSSINDILIQTFDPKGYLASRPIDWVRLLEGGGRFALCIAAAFMAAGMHKAKRPPPSSRSTQAIGLVAR